MSPFGKFNSAESIITSKEEKELSEKPTEIFDRILAEDGPEMAEDHLNTIKNNRELHPKLDDHWIDHQERKIFQRYHGEGRWKDAKRIVEGSIKESSKPGRMDRLKNLSGMNYEDI